MTEIDLPRRRDAEATQAAILNAARAAFSQKGFDGAGLREIAAAAGCNVALVNRYFGSKEGLFRAAMRGCFDMSDLLALPCEAFPEALAAYMVGKRKSAEEFDPMFAAIRSSTNPGILCIAREELGDTTAEALAAYLGGEDADERAALILSLMAGFDVGRHLIGNDALGFERDASLEARLAAAIRVLAEV